MSLTMTPTTSGPTRGGEHPRTLATLPSPVPLSWPCAGDPRPSGDADDRELSDPPVNSASRAARRRRRAERLKAWAAAVRHDLLADRSVEPRGLKMLEQKKEIVERYVVVPVEGNLLNESCRFDHMEGWWEK